MQLQSTLDKWNPYNQNALIWNEFSATVGAPIIEDPLYRESRIVESQVDFRELHLNDKTNLAMHSICITAIKSI